MGRPERARPVFFIDRSLGSRDVAGALLSAEVSVEIHDDHFEPGCDDQVWIREVAQRRWVILTKDKRMRRRRSEQIAIQEAQAAAFVLTAGDMTGEQMGRAFLLALARMEQLLEKYARPLIATVSKAGAVTVVVGERRGSIQR